MQSNKELSAIVRRAMQEKSLDEPGMAKLLGVSDVMVQKILCGDVVPSRYLEKQMIETLGIPAGTVRLVSARCQAKARAKQAADARTRKAA